MVGKKNKHFVFTSENHNWGGSELLWSETALKLSTSGFKVTICVNEQINLPDKFDESPVEIIRVPKARLSFLKRVLNRILPYKYEFRSKNKRWEQIKKLDPDLLIISQGYNFNGVKLMNLSYNHAIKYVSISQAVNEGIWPSEKLRRDMKMGFQNSMANYFVSEDNLEVTKSQLCCEINNAFVVRNPFNVPYNFSSPFPHHNDCYSLAFVGRYDFFAKGQDVLLRVLNMPKWRDRNLIVNFYGSGRDVQNIRDYIVFHQMNNVILNEFTDTIKIWEQNQGLILTSRFEGLPISLVEAMLCSRMVIVSDVSGNSEMVEESFNGFIAEAPRVKYVDLALERAWNLRGEWEQLGKNARETVTSYVPESPSEDFKNHLISI